MNANTMAAALDRKEQEDLIEEILREGQVRIDALGNILQGALGEKELQQLAQRIGFGYEECEKEHVG